MLRPTSPGPWLTSWDFSSISGGLPPRPIVEWLLLNEVVSNFCTMCLYLISMSEFWSSDTLCVSKTSSVFPVFKGGRSCWTRCAEPLTIIAIICWRLSDVPLYPGIRGCWWEQLISITHKLMNDKAQINPRLHVANIKAWLSHICTISPAFRIFWRLLRFACIVSSRAWELRFSKSSVITHEAIRARVFQVVSKFFRVVIVKDFDLYKWRNLTDALTEMLNDYFPSEKVPWTKLIMNTVWDT